MIIFSDKVHHMKYSISSDLFRWSYLIQLFIKGKTDAADLRQSYLSNEYGFSVEEVNDNSNHDYTA